jgi:hypothetical protein
MNEEEIQRNIEEALAINTSVDEPPSNEPKRTIFESIRSFNFYNDVTKVIRFNSYFKKLGFERVNVCGEFKIHTFYPQLTLMINPTLILSNDDDVGREYEQLTSKNIKRRETTFDLWDKFFLGKKGYLGLRAHTIIQRSGKEEVKPIKVEYEGKELMLGQYLKERNIVMLFINPFNTDYTTENNEYLELVLKIFEDKMKDVELNKVDVTEKMKNAFVDKFKREINNKLSEVKESLKYSEDEINNLQANMLRAIRNSQLNRKQIEGLISFSTSTDDTIKKAIEEVKKLPFVKDVRLTGSGIGLDVGKVNINYKGEDVYIGDFYLIISPDGIKVYCKNPIISRDGLEVSHPHIDGNHNCYGGERENKIMEFLSTFELQKLVFYVYMFLKTYTPNDSYNNLSMWVRDDLQRRTEERIENDDDISNADFQGDYFQERSRRDNGNGDDDENHFDDEDDRNSDDDDYDNEENEREFVGDCENCGDSIYGDSESYISNDDGHFCCRECLNDWTRNRDENRIDNNR